MSLIQQLRNEHAEIMRMLETGKETIASKEETVPDLRDYFQELRTILSAHLDLENKLIYPKFDSSDKQELKEMGKKFSGEMVGIAETVLAFFAKYEKDSLKALRENPEFNKEFLEIGAAVDKRIKIEEDILFPAYEQNF